MLLKAKHCEFVIKYTPDLPKHISWEEFEKKGYFVVPMPKDYKPTPALRWFAEGRRRLLQGSETVIDNHVP